MKVILLITNMLIVVILIAILYQMAYRKGIEYGICSQYEYGTYDLYLKCKKYDK